MEYHHAEAIVCAILTIAAHKKSPSGVGAAQDAIDTYRLILNLVRQQDGIHANPHEK